MNLTQQVVSRCLALIPLIRANQGISLDELAKKARIPKEQIANELGAVLLMCGVPPYFPHNYIGFAIEEGSVQITFADQFERPISLSALEALALKLACESVTLPDGNLPKEVGELLAKVEEGMAPEQRSQFRILARRVAVRDEDSLPDGLTARAAMGVAERRSLLLDYRSAGTDASRRRCIHPYGLIGRDGHWYLIAKDAESQDGRVVPFRLDRVRGIEMGDERFEIPADFRLDDWGQGSLVQGDGSRPIARVRFRGPSARWIRETADLGSMDEISEHEVIWRLPIRSEASLTRFLLGFGADAEVLEPRSLALAIQRAVQRVLEAHS